MTPAIHLFQRYGAAAIACGALLLAVPAAGIAQAAPKQAAPSAAPAGPDLDLSIHHYSRVLTAEGVLRESRYEETMLRRTGHVWLSRVLPRSASADHGDDHAQESKTPLAQKAGHEAHAHKHFNHVMLPRHVTREGDAMRLEFVNFRDREVVVIPPAEYENVNFDGSWVNAFFLLNPDRIAALPLSNRASPVAGARWREQEKNGLFQRVLWDDRRMIPLVVETGDRMGNFLERVEVKPQASVSRELPWQNIQGFAKKEYADFLD